jgi:hypothetical protein
VKGALTRLSFLLVTKNTEAAPFVSGRQGRQCHQPSQSLPANQHVLGSFSWWKQPRGRFLPHPTWLAQIAARIRGREHGWVCARGPQNPRVVRH